MLKEAAKPKADYNSPADMGALPPSPPWRAAVGHLVADPSSLPPVFDNALEELKKLHKDQVLWPRCSHHPKLPPRDGE